jgi:hypothetical protein
MMLWGLSDRAVKWMKQYAAGLLPESIPGTTDVSLGRIGKRELVARIRTRIDPVTEEGFSVDSYFIVGKRAQPIGQSVTRYFYPEPTEREFMPNVNASRLEVELFERAKRLVLAHDAAVNDEMRRTAEAA